MGWCVVQTKSGDQTGRAIRPLPLGYAFGAGPIPRVTPHNWTLTSDGARGRKIALRNFRRNARPAFRGSSTNACLLTRNATTLDPSGVGDAYDLGMKPTVPPKLPTRHPRPAGDSGQDHRSIAAHKQTAHREVQVLGVDERALRKGRPDQCYTILSITNGGP